jgi:hypothetical protein
MEMDWDPWTLDFPVFLGEKVPHHDILLFQVPGLGKDCRSV